MTSNSCVEISPTSWRTQGGFIWSLIGSAVGFANILSFSAQVYKNGGGAFLIPYCFALFLLGIPLLILEGIIGSRFQAPLVSAYGRVAGSFGKVFGWLAVLACLSIGGFYIVLTGYAAAYTYFSSIDAIPDNSKEFFLNTFLKITPALSDFGQLSLPIFLSTMAVAVISWFVLVRNVKDGIESVCSIFMPLLAILMTVFAVAVTLLPGGSLGWVHYLKPDFSKLGDAGLWRDVFGQLFFSLSLGLGIIVGYSRHTGKSANIAKAMVYVALGDFIVSFIAGAAIFGCIAHISHIQGVPFNSILTTDSTFEIGFILFPKMLKFFGTFGSQWIGTVFFFCIFIAGITGLFSIIESIAGNFEFEFKISRKRAVSIAISLLSLLSLFFCMGNGSHMIDALAPMVLGTYMLIGGLGLILAFWYRSQIVRDEMIGERSRFNFYAIAIRYIAPGILAIILVGNILGEIGNFDQAKAVRWGWLIVSLASGILLTTISTNKKKQSFETN